MDFNYVKVERRMGRESGGKSAERFILRVRVSLLVRLKRILQTFAMSHESHDGQPIGRQAQLPLVTSLLAAGGSSGAATVQNLVQSATSLISNQSSMARHKLENLCICTMHRR
jgi:hypothetical protein